MIYLFLSIVGGGVAVPGAFILLFTICMSLFKGDSFSLDLRKLCIVYLVTLVGFALWISAGISIGGG